MKAKNDAASDREEPTGEAAELLRGRQQALAILVTLGGSIVTVAFLGGAPLRGMAVQLVVLVLLGVQLFRGTVWARWVLVALIALAAAGNVTMAVGSFSGEGGGWIVNVGLAAIYVWCTFVLALSPAVGSFMAARRASRAREG